MEKALHKLLATLLFVSLGITTGWAHAVNKQTVEADNPVQPEEEVQTVDLPYSVAFDEDPTAEGGWTVVDNSMQAGTTWTYGSYTTFEGSRLGMGMQADYGGGPNGAGPNDYLVSPAFSLEAGKTYTIDMSYTTYQTGGNILLEYGTDITDVSSFTQFATAQKDGNGYYPNDKFELTVPEDGVYYIALHAKAVESSNYAYTYVFDFAVSEKPEEVKPVDLPYSIAFDEDPTAEAGWTVVDKSLQSGTTWTYGSYTTFEGSRLGMGMQADYGGGPNGAGPNDYLISPAFNLEAGKTYTIDMSYTTYQTGGNILLEYGTDITDVSSFTQFATAQKDGNKYYPNDKFELTVPEDGVYYIALHAKAVESSNYAYTYVFDFAVSEKPEEVKPTPLPYSIAFDEDPTAEAGWTVVDNSLQSGTTWTYGSYTTFEGSRLGMGMQADYGGGPNGAGPNDYLISPAFSLEAGKTYTIDMSYTTYQTGGNILLEYGTDITDVSSFTQFATAQNDGNKYYPNDKFELTVPEDGVYYIALHAKAVESSNYAYTYVFDFAISEADPTSINGICNIPNNAVVMVYTIDGRIASTNADFRNLAKGTYIVTVKADGKTQSFKIVK